MAFKQRMSEVWEAGTFLGYASSVKEANRMIAEYKAYGYDVSKVTTGHSVSYLKKVDPDFVVPGTPQKESVQEQVQAQEEAYQEFKEEEEKEKKEAGVVTKKEYVKVADPTGGTVLMEKSAAEFKEQKGSVTIMSPTEAFQKKQTEQLEAAAEAKQRRLEREEEVGYEPTPTPITPKPETVITVGKPAPVIAPTPAPKKTTKDVSATGLGVFAEKAGISPVTEPFDIPESLIQEVTTTSAKVLSAGLVLAQVDYAIETGKRGAMTGEWIEEKTERLKGEVESFEKKSKAYEEEIKGFEKDVYVQERRTDVYKQNLAVFETKLEAYETSPKKDEGAYEELVIKSESLKKEYASLASPGLQQKQAALVATGTVLKEEYEGLSKETKIHTTTVEAWSKAEPAPKPPDIFERTETAIVEKFKTLPGVSIAVKALKEAKETEISVGGSKITLWETPEMLEEQISESTGLKKSYLELRKKTKEMQQKRPIYTIASMTALAGGGAIRKAAGATALVPPEIRHEYARVPEEKLREKKLEIEGKGVIPSAKRVALGTGEVVAGWGAFAVERPLTTATAFEVWKALELGLGGAVGKTVTTVGGSKVSAGVAGQIASKAPQVAFTAFSGAMGVKQYIKERGEGLSIPESALIAATWVAPIAAERVVSKYITRKRLREIIPEEQFKAAKKVKAVKPSELNIMEVEAFVGKPVAAKVTMKYLKELHPSELLVLEKPKIVVGGSAAQKAAGALKRLSGDIDTYAGFPGLRAKQLATKLKAAEVKATWGMEKPGQIMETGQVFITDPLTGVSLHAVSFHTKRWMSAFPYALPKEVTPEGIEVVSIKEQALRKLEGRYKSGRAKDIPDFYEILKSQDIKALKPKSVVTGGSWFGRGRPVPTVENVRLESHHLSKDYAVIVERDAHKLAHAVESGRRAEASRLYKKLGYKPKEPTYPIPTSTIPIYPTPRPVSYPKPITPSLIYSKTTSLQYKPTPMPSKPKQITYPEPLYPSITPLTPTTYPGVKAPAYKPKPAPTTPVLYKKYEPTKKPTPMLYPKPTPYVSPLSYPSVTPAAYPKETAYPKQPVYQEYPTTPTYQTYPKKAEYPKPTTYPSYPTYPTYPQYPKPTKYPKKTPYTKYPKQTKYPSPIYPYETYPSYPKYPKTPGYPTYPAYPKYPTTPTYPSYPTYPKYPKPPPPPPPPPELLLGAPTLGAGGGGVGKRPKRPYGYHIDIYSASFKYTVPKAKKIALGGFVRPFPKAKKRRKKRKKKGALSLTEVM